MAPHIPSRHVQAEIDANPEKYLEPTGFIFHMSRCGSTLTANLLGASPYNLVYSESKPPVDVMSLCDAERCTEEQKVGTSIRHEWTVATGMVL